MARRRRIIVEEINRSVELEIRRGVDNVETYHVRIRDIEETTIKMHSPMVGGQRPREIKVGTPLIINEETRGAEPRSYTVAAGPDLNHPEQPHQYFDEKEEQWMLIAQQPDDQPIKRRELVRAKMNFPLTMKVSGGREYGEKENVLSVNLSGSGILLLVDLEDISELPRNTKVILNFRDFEAPLNQLPLIKGNVVRIYKHGDSLRRYAVGIKFDDFEELDATRRMSRKIEGAPEKERVQNEDDQQRIIQYVLKKQIENQALEWAQEESRQ